MTIKTLARSLSLGLMLSVAVVSHADARSRHRSKSNATDLAVMLLRKQARELDALRQELASIRKLLRPQMASIEPPAVATPAPAVPAVKPDLTAPIPIPDPDKTIRGYESAIARSAKLKDITPVLANKVASVLLACPGTRLTSGYRRGARVAGSRRPSLHSRYPSRAADLAGNPSCIRKKLAGWPGGLSTDYSAVRHYHVSYDPKGREWGARFAHYGHRRHIRHARHHRRYAAIP